jgi:hypothetical protein
MYSLHVRFRRFSFRFSAVVVACGSFATSLIAAEESSTAALAEKLQNPVADLISVQFQNNFNFGVGEHNGTLYLMNF